LNAKFAFAHEAPIYVPETDEVFFASNVGGPSSVIRKISLADVDAALKAVAVEGGNTTVNVSVTEVTSFFPPTTLILQVKISFTRQINLPESIQVTNGGTGPYHSSLLLITSGQNSIPPSIALVNPKSPNNVTVLLDNYYGRQFNSLNDIKIHRPSGNFFFTDVTCVFIAVVYKENVFKKTL
jgi:gluconolactonase